MLLLWRHIVMLSTIVAPEWHFCQIIVDLKYDITIVQYDITIVQYDITIVAPWHQAILKNIAGQYGILSRYAPLLKVMWPGIDQSALIIYMWHIIKSNTWGFDWLFHNIVQKAAEIILGQIRTLLSQSANNFQTNHNPDHQYLKYQNSNCFQKRVLPLYC